MTWLGESVWKTAKRIKWIRHAHSGRQPCRGIRYSHSVKSDYGRDKRHHRKARESESCDTQGKEVGRFREVPERIPPNQQGTCPQDQDNRGHHSPTRSDRKGERESREKRGVRNWDPLPCFSGPVGLGGYHVELPSSSQPFTLLAVYCIQGTPVFVRTFYPLIDSLPSPRSRRSYCEPPASGAPPPPLSFLLRGLRIVSQPPHCPSPS
ncbi:hypothetical protein VTK73DRAFT_1342 [Phialemonium thermophilum]|uniref:Uncharacterized protein n=1 Tax=Phialemonium thermophilum TaxID=223376 RepID=A0ABR3VTL4_9PEZI